MAIYRMTKEHIESIQHTDFAGEGILEGDIQALLRDRIDVVSSDTLVIAEEFGDWEDSGRSIDLLGVDKNANLVVIELKRTGDGGHMELQALRYAAMVSTMTFDQAVDTYARYPRGRRIERDARAELLDFLEWPDPDETRFAQDVRLVLVSADFSKEVTSAVLWLNERQLDIRCVRMRPYKDAADILVDVQQVIPLPEAADYQIAISGKRARAREDGGRTWNRESFVSVLARNTDPSVGDVARELIKWFESKSADISWGKGKDEGSFTPKYSVKGKAYNLGTYYTDGKSRHVIKPEDRNLDIKVIGAFRNKVNSIPRSDVFKARTLFGFDMSSLSNPESMKMFKDACEYLIDEIRKLDTT